MPSDSDKICTEEDLKKVDAVNNLIKSLSSADTVDKLQEASSEIDNYLQQSEEKKKSGAINRTVINKNAYKNDDKPRGAAEQSKEAFMAVVEADARERAERRRKNRARADKKKEVANDYFKSGDMKKAIEIYSEAIDISRDYTALYTNRALAYMRTGDPEKAFEDCEWALRIEEDNVKAMIQRGRALLAMGKPDEAEENFQAVLKLDSTKVKLIGGYLDEVKQYHVAKQQENAALQRFDCSESEKSKGMLETLCKLANQNQPVMYYIGGVRLLANMMNMSEETTAGDSEETDRVLFRLKGGFKLLTADHKVIGSVLSSPLKDLSEEQQNLLLSVFELCTAVAKDDTENQKIVLQIDNIIARLIEVLSTVTKSDSQSSKIILSLRHAAVSLLYECAQYETGRICLVETIKSSLLLPLILGYIREVQEKREGLLAAKMLQNLAESRRFQASFNGKLDQSTMQNLEALLTQGGKGPSTLAALPTCLEFLVSMCSDAKIVETLAKRNQMLLACTKTFERHAPMHSDPDHQVLLISLIRLILTLSTVRNNSFEPIASRLLDSATRILTELHEGRIREILLPLIAAIFKYLTKEQIKKWCDPSTAAPSVSHPSSPPITPISPPSFSRQTVSCCVRLLLAIVEVESHPQLPDALRILGSCVQIHDNTRFLVGDDVSIVRRLHKLLRPFKGFDESLAGNASMLMLNCVTDTRMAEHLTASTIIQDLLSLCQEANVTDTRRNAAILAGKLATANNRHREEISRLEGWSILSKFNEWAPGAKR